MPTSPQDPAVPRLTLALHALLAKQRVAALGTSNLDATPFVSMVPFAIDAQTGCIIIHVSTLAPHTRNLQINQNVSLMVMEPEVPDAPVHALPRVSMQGFAHFLVQDDPRWVSACSSYLNRFPEAEPMTQFGDFRFVTIVLTGAHQVAGFGAARTINAATLAHLLTTPASP